jgi:hypothetical protein
MAVVQCWLIKVAYAPASKGKIANNAVSNPQPGSSLFMNAFSDYFSDPEIITQLCRARIKLAGSRNERQYVGRLIGSLPSRLSHLEVDELLPARQQWSRFRPKHRTPHRDSNFISLM